MAPAPIRSCIRLTLRKAGPRSTPRWADKHLELVHDRAQASEAMTGADKQPIREPKDRAEVPSGGVA